MATTGLINFSGFNGFDFSSVINAIMQQESIPLTNLQTQQQAVKDRNSAYSQLGSQIASLESATNTLLAGDAFSQVSSNSSDTSIVTTTAGSSAIPGHYDIVIDHTAKP